MAASEKFCSEINSLSRLTSNPHRRFICSPCRENFVLVAKTFCGLLVSERRTKKHSRFGSEGGFNTPGPVLDAKDELLKDTGFPSEGKG